MEKSMEYNKTLYVAIKITKGTDSVQCPAVIEALAGPGVEEAYTVLLNYRYNEYTGPITLHKKSAKFDIRKGVAQGDTISTKLFTERL